MPLSGLDRLLWAIGLFGHLVLLGVLFGRRRAFQFPIFTCLIAASVLRTLVLFVLREQVRAYMVAYVTTDFVDTALQLAVVYEVAWHVFRPLGRWAPDARRHIRWVILASLAVASAMTWLAAPDVGSWERIVLVKADFFSSTLMSELFLGMIILSVTAGLPWRTHVARIAHGLGVYSFLDLAIEAAHTMYGSSSYQGLQRALTSARKGVYLLVLVYWIVTLWRDAPQPPELSDEVREHLRGLQARLAYDLGTLRSWRKP